MLYVSYLLVSYLLIGLGGLICLANWWICWLQWSRKARTSFIPVVGGTILLFGFELQPATYPIWWLAIIADPSFLALALALPFVIYELWITSRFNLIHRLECNRPERRIRISLFRKHHAVIEMSFVPAVACSSFASVVSTSWVASWETTSEGLELKGFDGNRRLIFCQSDEHYEVNDPDYPPDKEYPYDNLNGVQLWKVS